MKVLYSVNYSSMRQRIILYTAALAATWSLTAVAQEGYLIARGRPGNAGVFVDGKYIGPASRFTVPEKYAVPAGEHEIAIRDPRYEEMVTKVTVGEKKKTRVKYSLKRLPEPQGPFGLLKLGGDGPESFISIAAGDTGAVYLNDKFYGHVDEFNNAGSGILLPAGKYKLRVESSAYPINQEVTIEANKRTKVELPGAKK